MVRPFCRPSGAGETELELNFPTQGWRPGLLTGAPPGLKTTSRIATESSALTGRLSGAPGGYSASPIAADGKLYAISEDGVVSVIRAGADWEVVATNDLGAPAKATPAIAGGRLYVRTASALFCFEEKEGEATPPPS